MLETLDRMMLAGLGMLSMTRQRAEEIFEEYVQRGQAERSQRAGFVQNLVDSAEQTRKELQDLVTKQVRETADRLNLASKEDLARVEAKLDSLLNRKK